MQPAITAIQLYDEALLHAKKQGLYMLVGLISEHAGLFYLSLNASTTAHSHFCAAYQAFLVRLPPLSALPASVLHASYCVCLLLR